jgi:ribosomal protein S18 acetylase RimI-like enzyme
VKKILKMICKFNSLYRQKLLNFIEDLAKNRKLKRIVLEVEKKNLNAIKVYENFGFKKEKEIFLKIDRKKFSFYKMIKTI